MKRSFVSSRQSAFLIILVLLVAALFITIYYFLIENKKEYLIQRNFRQMNYISNFLQQKINSSWDVVTYKPGNKSILNKKPESISVDFQVTQNHLIMDVTYKIGSFITTEVFRDILGLFETKKEQNLFNDLFLVKIVIDSSNNYFERVIQLPEHVTVIKNLDYIITGKDTLRFKNLTDKDSFTEINSGGEDYLLFIHPMNINLPGRSSHSFESWILCGITSLTNFNAEVQSLSPNVILIFIDLILLLLLAWPLLKLKFVSRYGHVKSADIVLTVLSVIFASVAISYTAMDYMITINQNDHVQRQLRIIAEGMKENLQGEINAAYNELRKKTLRKSLWSSGANYFNFTTQAKIDTQLQYTLLYLMDSKSGNQKYKSPVTKKRTPFINLTQRNYFRQSSRDMLWKNAAGIDQGIILEPHISYTTGEFEITLATRMKFKDTNYIAAIDFLPVSVYSPVLPRGFSFAVINPEGMVLFHTIKDKILVEDFFAETENPEVLKAAILTGSSELFNSAYWGNRIQGYITPLDGIPWHIIVMFEKDTLRYNNLIIIYLAITLFILYLIPFLIFLVVLLMKKESARNWIWVQIPQTGTYNHLIAAFISYAVGLLGIIIFYSLDNPQPVLSLFIFPHVAFVYGVTAILVNQYIEQSKRASVTSFTMIVDYLLISILLLANNLFTELFLPLLISAAVTFSMIKFRPFFRTAKKNLTIVDSAKRYAWMLLLLLALGSILPAIGFFAISYKSQVQSYIKHAHIDYIEKLKDRNIEIQESFSDPAKYEHTLVKAFIAKRMKQENDLYAKDFYEMEILTDTLEQKLSSWFDNSIAHYIIPAVSRIGSESRLLKVNPDNENIIWFKDSLLYHQNKSFSESSIIQSKTPPLIEAFAGTNNSFWISLKRLLIFSILIFAFYKLFYNLIYYTLKAAFLIEADDQSEIRPDLILNSSSNILLLPPGSLLFQHQLGENGNAADTRSLIKEIRRPPSLEAKYQWKLLPDVSSKSEIMINNFEYGFTNPDINMEKLSLLETLIFTHKMRVVIISAVHPLGGFQCVKEESDISVRKKILNRWKNVLSGFVVLSHNSFPTREPEKVTLHIQEKTEPAELYNTTSIEKTITSVENRFMRSAVIRSVMEFFNAIHFSASARNRRKFEQLTHELKSQFIMKMHPHLYAIAMKPDNYQDYTYPLFFDLMMEKTRSYHQMLWDSCSMDEKLVLTRLVTDRFVSIGNLSTVELLFRRGLIKRDVNVKPFNIFFSSFIFEANLPEEEFWAEQDSGNSWNMLRIPLLIILIGITVFLFSTQNQLIGTITAASALIPALLRLLGIFQSQKNILKEGE